MSAGYQCDWCRRFMPGQGPGMLHLVSHQSVSDPMAMLAAAIGHAQAQEPLTFCGMLCVAQYAYAQAMTTGPATGAEPQAGGSS